MRAIPSSIISFISNRTLRQDLDVIAACTGERGSCKSGTAQMLQYLGDRDTEGRSRGFLPKEMYPKGFYLNPGEMLPRVVFRPSDFLRLVTEYNLPKNSYIIWDETGVEGDARDFQTRKNKLLKRTFETIRSKNLVILLTSPSVKSFDSSIRRNLTLSIFCKGKTVSPQSGKECAKVYIQQQMTMASGEEDIRKNFKDRDKEGMLFKVNPFYVARPPAFIEKPYKRYKELFLGALYSDYLKELEADNIETHDESLDTKELTKEVMKNLRVYFNFEKRTFVSEALMFGLGLKLNRATQLKRFLDLQVGNGILNPKDSSTNIRSKESVV